MKVEGYSTPAVQDVGGASLRLRYDAKTSSLREGGYLLAIRAESAECWLPAIAGVPGGKGLDRHGNSRVDLAELMIMGRPVVVGRHDSTPLKSEHITFLAEDTLRQFLPEGAHVEVVNVVRLTDFFLGLNAGPHSITPTLTITFNAES